MRPLRAAGLGFEGALGAPLLILAFWLVNLLVALPAGVLMAEAIRSDLGASAAQEDLRQGFDTPWYSEFEDRSSGISKTFTPARVVGVGPLLENLEGWATGGPLLVSPGLIALAIFFVALWSLLLAGAVDRFGDAWHPGGISAFLAAGGRYWARFLRLTLISSPLYYLIYRLYRKLLGHIETATVDVTRETTVLAWVLAATALTGVLLAVVKTAFDYAKIAIVLEQRRSSFLAAWTGLGFVLRRPLKTLGLALTFSLLLVLLMAVYGWLAPGTGQGTWLWVILALSVGQLYLILRITLRLALLAGEIALYRDLRRL